MLSTKKDTCCALLPNSTSEDYYLNPEVALALCLGKHTHKIFLLSIVKIKITHWTD